MVSSKYGLVFLFFPFISIPLLPGSYKPVILVAFVLLYPFIFIDNAKRKELQLDFKLLAFLLSVVMYSFFQAEFFGKLNYMFYKELITIVIAVVSYVSIYSYVRRFGIENTLSYLYLSLIFLLFFGYLELLGYFVGFKYTLNELLSGRETSRFQLTTSEGSWGSRLILFYLPISYLFYKRKVRYSSFVFFSCILFLLLTFSIESFFYLGFFLIYCYLNKDVNLRTKIFYIFKFVLFAYCLYLSLVYFSVYLKESDLYYVSRFYGLINALNEFDFIYFLEIDESIFVRVIYPLVSVDVFLSNPIFGVGLGSYPDQFNKEIIKYLDYLAFNREVYQDIFENTGDPRFLIGKILSHFGIFGMALVLIFFYEVKKLFKSNLKSEYFVTSKHCLILSLISTIQFGSYFYAPLIVSLAMAFSLKKGFYE